MCIVNVRLSCEIKYYYDKKFMCITHVRLGCEIKYYHDKVYVYCSC